MSFSRHGRTVSALAIVMLLALPPAAFPQSELALDMQLVTGDDAPMDLRFWTGAGPVRVDLSTQAGPVSLISSNGIIMILLHQQRMMMEGTRDTIAGALQFLGLNVDNLEAAEAPAVAEWTFERTGATDAINGMSAFEVRMTGPDGQAGALWMTLDSDFGLFEATERLQAPLQEAGIAAAGPLQGFLASARTQSLPEGRVIRIVVDNDDGGLTLTLTGVEEGPFPVDTWVAPAGYGKLPMMFPR